METTGNFESSQILKHEENLNLSSLTNLEARNLPIAIQVQIGEWVVFKAALPGSKPENDGWIKRKANVVLLTQHSTMYERVSAEEAGIDWHLKHGVVDQTHAIHGGGFPLKTSEGLQGILLISGLPQVEDHLFAVEVLNLYKNNK